MAAKRQTRGGKVSDVQKALRRDWVLRIRQLQVRSTERTAAIKQMMAECGLRQSRAYDLIKRYKDDGGDGLERQQRSDAGRSRFPADLMDLAVGFVTAQQRVHRPFRLRWQQCRDLFLKTHPGERFPSEATLARHVREADPGLLMTKRERAAARTRRLKLASPYPNFLWQADQRQADLFVVDVDRRTGEILVDRPYRPLLFSFVDYSSGAVMGGWYYKGNHQAYDTGVVETSLLDAIYPDVERGLPMCGVPEIIYWDNGKPHSSQWMLDAAQELGIELLFSKPAEPMSHGFIEGYHHLIKDRFESDLPGFCGGDNKGEHRPLQMRLQLEGEAPPPEYLTLDQLNRRWREFLVDLHEAEYCKGPCRRVRWASEVSPERRAVPDPKRLGLAFMQKATAKISTSGHFQHRTVTYSGPHLGSLAGTTVQIRYVDGDLHHVYVMLDGAVFSVATPLDPHVYRDVAGFKDLEAAKKEFRVYERGARDSRRALDAAVASGLVDEAEAEAAKDALQKVHKPLPARDRARLVAQIRELDKKHGREPGLAEVVDLPVPSATHVLASDRPATPIDDLLPDAPVTRRLAAVGDVHDDYF